ncbi:mitochondrial 37S ribosomal protein nam9 [Serendipita sp. 401]|nr:mitochondrial 37S ribosomal protein nam9 [Serendipita sp. 401]KAG9058725.1 mitochondrial 37S ribosomal protein nam9 [Serendipita sp. 407]
MRYENVYSISRALPRMSWSGINLYNLYTRSLGAGSGPDETTFKRTFLTLFQQRWKAKRLVRAYHGDYIGEKKFKRWYLPELIPDVRPKRPIGLKRTVDSLRISNRTKEAAILERKAQLEDEALAGAPVGSLMFIEIEKRIDTIVFRSCLATSIYQARHLVLAGKVKLNGIVCKQPSKRLEPGDLISVDPDAISFLRHSSLSTSPRRTKDAVEEAEEEAVSTDETEGREEEGAQDSAAEQDVESKEPLPPAEASTEASVLPEEPPHESRYRQKKIAKVESQDNGDIGHYLHLPDYAAAFLFVPAYLEVSFVTCSAVYVRHPTARKNYSELPTPYDADGEIVRLAWEWYVKVRPRMRGKLQRETGPHGTRRPVPYWSQYQR